MIDDQESAIETDAESPTDVTEDSETPNSFLAKLGKALKNASDVDSELADILSDHLLVSEPTSDAVAGSKGAIMALAKRRANPPEKKCTDD